MQNSKSISLTCLTLKFNAFCCFSVWAQIMNRQQQRLDLILIPVENFCCEPYNSNPSTPEQEDMWKSSVNESPKPIQVHWK